MEKRKSDYSFLYIAFLLTILFIATLMPTIKPAYAQEVEQSEKTQAQTIIDEVSFIAWRKGEDAESGKFLVACFYVPNEVYSAECSYNVFYCPKVYLERANATDDYIEIFQEKNMQYLTIPGAKYQSAPNGKVFRMGISNMREANLEIEFAYILYVQDKDGNIEYFTPQYAKYNSDVGADYSNEELLDILDKKLNMDGNFKGIVTKLEELVDFVWLYVVIACVAVVVVWGAYIGVKVIIAKKNDEKVNAKGMVKGLVIGIVIMFIFALGAPLLIKGLGAWVG